MVTLQQGRLPLALLMCDVLCTVGSLEHPGPYPLDGNSADLPHPTQL